MRLTAAALGLLVAFPLFAAYDVTATMPATAGATGCQLWLDGAPVGGVVPCGVAQDYPALIAAAGSYAFTYRAVNASGQSAASPVTTVLIEVLPPPANPTSPVSVVVSCAPSPCPPSVVITVSP